jgi:putative ABC transport system permease protein
MGALTARVGGDLRRRRLQTGVLAVVLFLASGAAALAMHVLVAADEPFERAFADAMGAHLVVDFDESVAMTDVVATGSRPAVTASSGPWVVAAGGIGRAGGGASEGHVLVGREDPLGPVDRIAIAEGRWWRTHDEVVVSWSTAEIFELRVGDRLSVYGASSPAPAGDGERILIDPKQTIAPPEPVATPTVVGIARSISTPEVAAWVSPSVVEAVAGEAGPDLQMLYRIGPGASEADLSAALGEIAAGLPIDAISGTYTYLRTQADVDDTARLYVPILLAFSAFALVAAGFTIANVVSGIVLSGYREIGVLKAVGFTPNQVTAMLEAQTLVPVVAGTVAGIAAGTLASVSTVERMTQSFGLPASFTVSVPVLVGVLATCVAIAVLAAAVPAIQAGRSSATRAISGAAGPIHGVGGGRLRRLGLRLPVTVPIRLGVAAGAAHPVRAAMTLGAVLVGVAAATFALGVNLSLVRIIEQIDRTEASPVRAQIGQPAQDTAAVTSSIAQNPDTERFVTIREAQVTVRGFGEATFVGYDGDSGWLGFEMIHGRWPAGLGEVVAPTALMARAGLELGDTVELSDAGRTTSATLVGEVFDTGGGPSDTLVLRGSMSDLTALDPTAPVSGWEIRPRPGVEPARYAEWLMGATGGRVGAYTIDDSTADEEFLLFLSVVATMGIVLVAIAFGGVFNTVLLETRQRTREMAVLKALGMAPRQVVAMVVASVVPVGLAAGLLGVPIGLVFQRAVLSYMGQVVGGTGIPDSSFDVFGPVFLTLLAMGGLAIAVAGAYLPAQRAARARIAPVLLAE